MGNITRAIGQQPRSFDELIDDAIYVWIAEHGIPESIATSGNPFVAAAESAFWRTVESLGRMPRDHT